MNVKKQIAAALLLSAAATVASAHDWVQVGKNQADIMLVDAPSIAKSDYVRTAWVKDITLDIGGFSIEKAVFNCRTRYMAIYSGTSFDSRGNVLNVIAPSVSNIDATAAEVLPDSVGESALEYVCAH